jgi:hypothetical protein
MNRETFIEQLNSLIQADEKQFGYVKPTRITDHFFPYIEAYNKLTSKLEQDLIVAYQTNQKLINTLQNLYKEGNTLIKTVDTPYNNGFIDGLRYMRDLIAPILKEMKL